MRMQKLHVVLPTLGTSKVNQVRTGKRRAISEMSILFISFFPIISSQVLGEEKKTHIFRNVRGELTSVDQIHGQVESHSQVQVKVHVLEIHLKVLIFAFLYLSSFTPPSLACAA